MAVTILAVAFLVLMTAIAFAGFRMFGRRRAPQTGPDMQKCSLCLRPFETHLLVERQVGDYRQLRFCRECILGLASDLGLKN
ncbi:MAG TPA: hypothetical protein VI215_09215 [Bacteroidota bacterium]|jgi:hypothetical protein